MNIIEITEEYITLGQLLKLANIVGSGVEAKYLILDGQVLLNDQVEMRRGKKVRSGDIVEVKGQERISVIKKENS